MTTGKVALVLFACGALVAGCGSAGSASRTTAATSRASHELNTPLNAALAWFRAIDAKDRRQVLAAFAPGYSSATSWSQWGVDSWPTFSAVKCKGESRTPSAATVACTFSESQAPSAGNRVSFWTVSFMRTPQGRWLIENYGQG